MSSRRHDRLNEKSKNRIECKEENGCALSFYCCVVCIFHWSLLIIGRFGHLLGQRCESLKTTVTCETMRGQHERIVSACLFRHTSEYHCSEHTQQAIVNFEVRCRNLRN